MNKILYLLIFIPYFLIAQPGEWTWMKGADTVNQHGIFGTKGIEASSNNPGSRYEGGSMRDSLNNFWLFGGSGYDYHTGPGFLNDLWRYNPSTNNWTFMSGDSIISQPAVYGTQGTPSPANKPGGRYAFVTWSDEVNGALWLFGGSGPVVPNDLWRYDIASNEWTWMSGSSSGNPGGVYGTKGVAAPGNVPGFRSEVTSSWIDDNGNLWLFGGTGKDGFGNLGYLNDLWMYNISTNQWTWISGDNIINQTGIYGTKGLSSPSNIPCGRYPYCSWKDLNGNFWLFGGIDYNSSYYNDLWKYNVTTNQWTWISGSNTGTFGLSGWHYGEKCIGDSMNIPGRRFENKARWVDACGNFWLYGGFTPIGDLWSYNPATNKWTWVSGDTATYGVAVYGSQGVSNAANKPGARYGAPSWKHSDGSLWMFGGPDGNGGRHNDLWRYVIDTVCVSCGIAVLPPVASFQASDTVLCSGDCIMFTNLSTNATSWQWSFSGATPSSSTLQNPQSICYQTAGKFNASLVAWGSGKSDTLSLTNYILVNPSPPPPAITPSHDTLYCSTDQSYTSYQWYLDSNLIAGATSSSYYATKSGNYNVKVTSENGCFIGAGINFTYIGLYSFTPSGLPFAIISNPAGNELTIYGLTSGSRGLQFMHDAVIEIYNTLGQKIYIRQPAIPNLQSTIDIDVSTFPAGVYFIQVRNEVNRWVWRFMKE